MMVREKEIQIILGTSNYNEKDRDVIREQEMKKVNNLESLVYVAPWHVYDQPS